MQAERQKAPGAEHLHVGTGRLLAGRSFLTPRPWGGDRVLRGCLTIRHYNGYNGGRQTASRRYTFPPAGRTAGQAPENHTSTRLTCAASTYNPSPFRYWRVFLGAMPLLRAVRLGGIAFLFLSLLYAISPSFASCILYKLTKVICIYSTISACCIFLGCICTHYADSSSHASCMVSAEKRNSPYSE